MVSWIRHDSQFVIFCNYSCLLADFRNQIIQLHLLSFGKCLSKQLSINSIIELRPIQLIVESIKFFQCDEVTQKLSGFLWLLWDSLRIYRITLYNYLYHRVTRRIHGVSQRLKTHSSLTFGQVHQMF